MIANKKFREGVATKIVDTFGYFPGFDEMYVYSGTIPADVDVDNWTLAGYSAQQLCTITGWSLKVDTAQTDNIVFNVFPSLSTVTATGTGTASWYVGWVSNLWWMGTVTDPGGNGSLQIDDVNIVSGNDVIVIDFNLRVAIAYSRINMANIKLQSNFTETITDASGLGGTRYMDRVGSSFSIMQGIIPTQNELDAAINDFRSADILVNFDVQSSISYAPEIAKVIIRNVTETATASGTATWWYWDAYPAGTTIDSGIRLAGTVSAIGGGGELEVSDVSITSGQVYRIGTVSFTFPQYYTYT